MTWRAAVGRTARAIRPRLPAPIPPPPDDGERAGLQDWFDGEHYSRQLPAAVADPLDNYLRLGWAVGLDPHPMFSTRFYLDGNPDVAGSGTCPLVHYVRHGRYEGRSPHPLFDVDHYRTQLRTPVDDPLLHYLQIGWTLDLDPHPLFSTRFYLDSNADVAASGLCPLVHYVRCGGQEDRSPHPAFNPLFYGGGVRSDPGTRFLVHFLLAGEQPGRGPGGSSLDATGADGAALRQALAEFASTISRFTEHARRGAVTLRELSLPTTAAGRYRATIVLPLLRQRDEWLETSIRSALAQTVPCEVVVVTSPQTPPSNLALLSRLEQRHENLVVLERDRPGFAAGMNTGIAAATAERVGFLLSDDWIDPDTVRACLASPADIVSTGRRCYTADGLRELVRLRRSTNLAEFRAQPTLERQADYLTHFFLIRRDRLLAVGGLDESLGDSPGIDDYDLIWVLLEQGASVDVVDQLAYNCRDHEGERLTLRHPDEMRATLARILSKHGIADPERSAMVAEKSTWFGRPLGDVAAAPAPRPGARVGGATAAPASLGVCVLFHERPDQTIECLESLRDGGPVVYVLDNGSSPAARQRVGDYERERPDVVLIDSAVNLGVAVGRNRLIEGTTEELLFFLDSDITVRTAGWATVLQERARDWPDVDVLVPVLFDVQKGRIDETGGFFLRGDEFVHAPARDGSTNLFPGGAACVRRTLFERLGPYDESIFVGLEDFELAIRALRGGRPVRARTVPDVLLHHDRRAAHDEADVDAALTRYSTVHVQRAYDRVLEKHGVRYASNWKDWLQDQAEHAAGTGPADPPG